MRMRNLSQMNFVVLFYFSIFSDIPTYSSPSQHPSFRRYLPVDFRLRPIPHLLALPFLFRSPVTPFYARLEPNDGWYGPYWLLNLFFLWCVTITLECNIYIHNIVAFSIFRCDHQCITHIANFTICLYYFSLNFFEGVFFFFI